MKDKYYFYAKADAKKEKIGDVSANSLMEAIEFFATMKLLSIDSFLQIYNVKLLDATNRK